ncbi:MAG: phage head closure protein [Methylobacteriaceae bacterium]|nr:phage head closure protein [Methylobacteriaceae bacterium]
MRNRAFVGIMRQRLSLEAASESSDESGALQATWSPQGDLWGQIVPASSGDRFLADRQEEAVTHRILTRWRSDMQSGMRFRLGARTFLVRSVFDPDERRRMLICRCEEIKP